MMTNSPTGRQISLSRVAEMANTTSQAVSNWRRRFEDFPRPVAGTDRRPLFDLDETIAWLKANNRYNNTPGFATRMWAFMDGLRAVLPPGESLLTALSAVAWQSMTREPVSGDFTVSGHETPLPPEIRLSPEIEQEDTFRSKLGHLDDWAKSTLVYPYGEIFTPLLQALPRSGALFMPTVIPGVVDAPESPAELQDALDELFNRAGTHDTTGRTPALIRHIAASVLDIRDGATVLDAASGSGSFLLEAGIRSPKTRRIGVENNDHELKVAALASIISGIPLSLHRGDSIHDDPVAEIIADSVFINPPWQRLRSFKSLQGDPRWAFGVPTADYDLAWVQHALARLSVDGRAAVVLPPRSLWSGAGQKIRAALIRRGAVEAVIALPKGTYPGTPVAPTLWLLRRSGHEEPGQDGVLLIDASETVSSDFESFQWVANTVLEHRSGGALTTGRPYAAAIPAVELLSEETNLTPSRWLAELSQVDQHTIEMKSNELQTAVAALAEARSPATVSVTDAVAPMVKVGDLIKAKSLKVIRARPVPSKDLQDEGPVRYLTPAGLAGHGNEQYVDDQTAVEAQLTIPGDIAVWSGGNGVRAVVLRDGGAVPSTHLQLLRVLDGSFDPEYLAACLASKRNERFLQGATVLRPKLQDFEVPSLTLAEQQRLSQELQYLSDLQTRASKVSEEVTELSAHIINTIGEGTLRIR